MKKEISYAELFALADDARAMSYCPYSGISVGAALLTESGKVYTGANIENASFSPTVCAERVAIFKAINDGERHFSAIAVSGGKSGSLPEEDFPPCGVCRQVMAEFCDSEFVIILSEDGKKAFTLSEILPLRFGKENF